MKRLILIVLFFVGAFAIYWFNFRDNQVPEAPKQQPLAISRHSAVFNQGFSGFMNQYFDLKAAFVDADTVRVKTAVRNFIAAADSLDMNELKKDTSGIYETAASQLADARSNAESLSMQKDLTEMRKDFGMVSESLYPLLKLVNYGGKTLYWQNCPMAFGDDKGANWISNTSEIVNPYLGKNHPEFKGTMLHCGEVKDSIAAN